MTKETNAASPLSLADAKVSSMRPPRPLFISDVLMVLDRFKCVCKGLYFGWSMLVVNSVDDKIALEEIPKDCGPQNDLCIELKRI